MRIALKYAVDASILTAAEADELKGLLDYRNDIANDVHLVMADSVSVSASAALGGMNAARTKAIARISILTTNCKT